MLQISWETNMTANLILTPSQSLNACSCSNLEQIELLQDGLSLGRGRRECPRGAASARPEARYNTPGKASSQGRVYRGSVAGRINGSFCGNLKARCPVGEVGKSGDRERPAKVAHLHHSESQHSRQSLEIRSGEKSGWIDIRDRTKREGGGRAMACETRSSDGSFGLRHRPIGSAL
jgi:hypothetical protein